MNNEEVLKIKLDNNSSASANEEEPKDKVGDNSSTTVNTEESSQEKTNDDASTRTGAYQNKHNKADNKGFNDFNKDTKSRREDGTKPYEDKDRESSATEEKNKYSSLTIEELYDLKNRYENKISILNEEEKNNNDKIRRKQSAKSKEKDQEREIHYKQEIEDLKKEVEIIGQKKDEYWQELKQIKSEIKRKYENSNRDNYSKTKNSESQSPSSETDEKMTAESLFTDDDLIKNTVLYVATFFPRLNPQDFKRIVKDLLNGKITTIPEKENITTEEGKILVKETNKEKLLTKIWEESFDKPDKYLKKCHLKVSRHNDQQGIDFIIPELRKDLLSYFETEQSFFLAEQLQRTQKLNLLLDKSENVAEKAMKIAVIAAIDYSNEYDEKWLIELLEEIYKEDDGRSKVLIKRLYELIYKLQVNVDYSRSKNIAQSLLERLIFSDNTDYALKIFKYLTEKHLSSGIIGFQSAKQLMDWLKKLLDNNKIKEEKTYLLLDELLWDSGYNLYVYDFLEIFKEWFPKHDISPKEYSLSNKIAFILLYYYYRDTIHLLPIKFYGRWSSLHPLFAPFFNEYNDKINKQLEILFGLLFYSYSEEQKEELAIKYVFRSYEIDINYIEKISLFVSEWLVILLGFNNVEPPQQVVDLVEYILRQIIVNTSRHQQKLLNDCWASLTEEYLDLAIKHKELGNKEFQKQFTARRKILKNFRKQFKSLQKEMKLTTLN